MPPLQTPDTTHAQIVAWIITLLTSAGIWNFLDMTDPQKGAVVGGMIALIGAAHTLADAAIRRGRVPLAVVQLEELMLHQRASDADPTPDGDDREATMESQVEVASKQSRKPGV